MYGLFKVCLLYLSVASAQAVGTNSPTGRYLEHFSKSTSETSTYFHNAIRQLYPIEQYPSYLVTQEDDFNFLRFASSVNSTVSALAHVESFLELQSWYRFNTRREGKGGFLSEESHIDEWDLVWKGHQFKILVVKWEMPWGGLQTQSHIFSPEESDGQSRRFLLAVLNFNTDTRESILSFDGSSWNADFKLYQSIQQASWDDVILDPEFKDAIIHEYTSFLESEETYKNYGVPWKRGLIFLGPAGNGKSISLKALMRDVGADIPILYVKSFRDIFGRPDEVAIRAVFQRARAEAPCVLVLEDLDSLITDMNRDFFLNEVDGLENNDGLLLIATTNHFDKLDPALSKTVPLGLIANIADLRIDFSTFNDPTRAERLLYARYWQKKLVNNTRTPIHLSEYLLQKIADETAGFSFSYLKEAFVSSLLTLAGEEGRKPRPFREVILEQIKSLKSQLNKKHINAVGITPVEKSVPLEKLNTFAVQTRDQVYSYFRGYSMLSKKFKEDKE